MSGVWFCKIIIKPEDRTPLICSLLRLKFTFALIVKKSLTKFSSFRQQTLRKTLVKMVLVLKQFIVSSFNKKYLSQSYTEPST